MRNSSNNNIMKGAVQLQAMVFLLLQVLSNNLGRAGGQSPTASEADCAVEYANAVSQCAMYAPAGVPAATGSECCSDFKSLMENDDQQDCACKIGRTVFDIGTFNASLHSCAVNLSNHVRSCLHFSNVTDNDSAGATTIISFITLFVMLFFSILTPHIVRLY